MNREATARRRPLGKELPLDPLGSDAPHWTYVTATPLTGFGPTTHVVETCRALAARRSVQLVAPTPPPGDLDRSARSTSHVVPLPTAAPVEIRYQVRLARMLQRIAGDTDVIYLRAAAFNVGVLWAARRLNVPAVLELNGIPALEYRLLHPEPLGRLRSWVYGLFSRIDARMADGFVTVTPELADGVRSLGARRVHVASNGVDPDRVRPIPRQRARERIGMPRDAHVVGFVGHFAPWQGLETLLDGVAALRRARPELDVRLLMIGDGGAHADLVDRSESLEVAVRFTGSLPREEVPACLSAADVLALPAAPIPRNRQTGLSPIKLFEYLALARPVIASDLASLRFIEEIGAGRTFRAGDADDFAEVLGQLLTLPGEEREEMQRRARLAAENRFSWQAVTDRIIHFVEGEVIPHHQGRSQ